MVKDSGLQVQDTGCLSQPLHIHQWCYVTVTIYSISAQRSACILPNQNGMSRCQLPLLSRADAHCACLSCACPPSLLPCLYITLCLDALQGVTVDTITPGNGKRLIGVLGVARPNAQQC